MKKKNKKKSFLIGQFKKKTASLHWPMLKTKKKMSFSNGQLQNDEGDEFLQLAHFKQKVMIFHWPLSNEEEVFGWLSQEETMSFCTGQAKKKRICL